MFTVLMSDTLEFSLERDSMPRLTKSIARREGYTSPRPDQRGLGGMPKEDDSLLPTLGLLRRRLLLGLLRSATFGSTCNSSALPTPFCWRLLLLFRSLGFCLSFLASRFLRAVGLGLFLFFSVLSTILHLSIFLLIRLSLRGAFCGFVLAARLVLIFTAAVLVLLRNLSSLHV